MRIHSIAVRNYRVHRELKVELDAHRTLIGGPNEVGKSTLAEAAHRALFLKAKITGDTRNSMVSAIHGGHPEVEVCFEAGGRHYRLLKRFSGTSGTTTLSEKDGMPLNGEDAENRLAEILGASAAGGRNAAERASEQWAHLWVWQGRACDDPADYANAQKNDLLARLQNAGGAVIMQSELDAIVAARFKVEREVIFNRNETPKKDSELGRATEAAQFAANAKQQARETYDKLQKAVSDFEEANSTIKSTGENLKLLLPQKEAIEAKLTRVAELKAQETLRDREAQTAKENYERLNKEDAHIRRLRSEIQTRNEALDPKNTEAQRLAAAAEEQKSKAQRAEAGFQAASDKVRAVRLRHELAASYVALFEKTQQHDQLSVRAEQVRKAKNELAGLVEKIAKLPAIDGPKLKALQKLEGQCSNAKAALEAMAAGIEVLASNQPVKVGGKKLRPAQSQIITEETEISIGTTTRLRINPGGGTSLVEARNKLTDAQEKLQAELDKLGIGSTTEASEAFTRRQQLQTDIQASEAKLEGLDAGGIEQQMSDATQALTAARSDVDRRSALVEEFAKPVNLANAKTLAVTLETQLGESESAERVAKLARDRTLRSQNEADELLKSALNAVAEEKRAIENIQAQISLLVDSHGDDAARAKKLAELLGSKTNADALLAETRKALTELQPELIEADRGRLARAVEQTRSTQNDANAKLAVARNQLLADGTTDPKEAVALAEAKAQSAQEHLASVQRRAKAIQMLDELFLNEQQALADQFTRPLTEKISGYVRCLFGADAQAAVMIENNSFTGVRLVRPSHGFGAFGFESLSGGAREQVAAAVRLAMAEVLAQGHDGCLPLVFDDAFAYSDPERVQTLQRMLDLAASRGLQVIILTCNPSDYAALGAKQVLLRVEARPTLPSAIQPPVATGNGFDSGADPVDGEGEHLIAPDAVTDDQCQLFLSTLESLGGSKGNLSLRQVLGWDESTYDAVKINLVAAGRLITGRGKGGSVSLTS